MFKSFSQYHYHGSGAAGGPANLSFKPSVASSIPVSGPANSQPSTPTSHPVTYSRAKISELVQVPPELSAFAAEPQFQQILLKVKEQTLINFISLNRLSENAVESVAIDAPNKDAAILARNLIETHFKLQMKLKMAESRLQKVQTDLFSAQGEIASGMMVEFTIPSDLIGLVIGKKGSRIKQIEQKTGVLAIHVNGESGRITVMGPDSASVQRARENLELYKESFDLQPQHCEWLSNRLNASTLADIKQVSSLMVARVNRDKCTLDVVGILASVRNAKIMLSTQLEYIDKQIEVVNSEKSTREQLQAVCEQYDCANVYNNDDSAGSATESPYTATSEVEVIHHSSSSINHGTKDNRYSNITDLFQVDADVSNSAVCGIDDCAYATKCNSFSNDSNTSSTLGGSSHINTESIRDYWQSWLDTHFAHIPELYRHYYATNLDNNQVDTLGTLKTILFSPKYTSYLCDTIKIRNVLWRDEIKALVAELDEDTLSSTIKPKSIVSDAAALSNSFQRLCTIDGSYITKGKSMEFCEVKPPGINGEMLYERDAAAIQLAATLLSGSGQGRTAIMDNCYGSGKTSLVYKFRKILNNVECGLKSKTEYLRLQSAVYLHINFFLFGTQNDPEKVVLKALCAALHSSTHASCFANGQIVSVDDLITTLVNTCIGTVLLLHFDDVGCFEAYGEEVGTKMLYTIWSIGYTLRCKGHFFVITGRSTLLHMIGTGNMGWKQVLGANHAMYNSPQSSVHIALPPLSVESIKRIIHEFNADHLGPMVTGIYNLTAGIPRAVYLVIKYLEFHTEETLDSSYDVIVRNLNESCSLQLLAKDYPKFRRCIELSWIEKHFTLEDIVLEENITVLMARLGLYRKNLRSGDKFTLLVPPFLLVHYYSTARPMISIQHHTDKGCRFESAFRRILYLRFISERCFQWSSVGLPYLSKIRCPFPSEHTAKAYVFPKITRVNVRLPCDIVKVMHLIHSVADKELPSTECSYSNLPDVYKQMRIGQVYYSVPMSRSADALIKCNSITIVCFQLKNIDTPLTEAQILTEAKKYKAVGFTVYMVVICSCGNGFSADKSLVCEGVKVSKHSVEAYFGENCLESMCVQD